MFGNTFEICMVPTNYNVITPLVRLIMLQYYYSYNIYKNFLNLLYYLMYSFLPKMNYLFSMDTVSIESLLLH